MITLRKFDFATVVCDGCARRIDSKVDDERLYDYDELVEFKLEDCGWQKVNENDDDKWLCPDCAKDESHRKHPGEGRIIVESEPLVGLECDLCGKTFENFEGYSCWTEESVTHEMARDDEWMEIDGKWYCPDCYCTCPGMQDENEENWEEKYCSKCPYKDDCNEVVPLDIPRCSAECKYAFKGEDGNWKRCTHYKKDGNGKTKCWLIADGSSECPRVAYWRDKGKPEQEAKNAKAREECHLDPEED